MRVYNLTTLQILLELRQLNEKTIKFNNVNIFNFLNMTKS